MGINLAPLIDVDTRTIEDLIPFEESKSPDTKTHIVRPTDNPHLDGPGITAQDIVSIARARGLVVTALCGYKWIPRHNPELHDSCPRCLDIAAQLIHKYES